jgi:hypothetical protein
MTTTLASALLYGLSHRIEMAKKGIINPTPLVLERAKQIVEALKKTRAK